MKRILYIIVIGLVSMTSCTKLYEMNQPKEAEIEYSPIWPLSGEWYVKYDDGSGYGDYSKLWTYNTSENIKDKFWISDGGHLGSDKAEFWSYCVKSNCNVDAKTFSGTSLKSTADKGGTLYDILINVSNGKVLVGGGKSTSGVTTDSIYFEVEFEDNPGTIYKCAGIRRTGFLEDEH